MAKNMGIYIDTIRIAYDTDVIKVSKIREKVIKALKTIDGIETLMVSDEEV